MEENDTLCVLRQRCPVKFCMKLINSGKEMLDFLQGDCGVRNNTQTYSSQMVEAF